MSAAIDGRCGNDAGNSCRFFSRVKRATTVRFAGFWYRKSDLWADTFTNVYGPSVQAIDPSGEIDEAQLLASTDEICEAHPDSLYALATV